MRGNEREKKREKERAFERIMARGVTMPIHLSRLE